MHREIRGFVLIIVLFFLLIITCLVLSGADTIILSRKMQASSQEESTLFYRALAGLAQLIATQEGVYVTLPYSPIQLNTSVTVLSQDDCGNQTVLLHSTAQLRNDAVILNSEDIFATVPKIAGCLSLPQHVCLWFSEK